MLDPFHLHFSLRKQAILLSLCRSSFYYKPLLNCDSEIANLIKEVYLGSDCRYGYRKITASLHQQGYQINHKKVLQLMQRMDIQGIYPKKFKATSLKGTHKIYPYLLEGLVISYPNQVWATDITYIALPGRFMYFIAIIDIYSRYIITHELAATMETSFCLQALERALHTATPFIFNTDQGAQFTSEAFVTVLLGHHVQISMDHKGRCFDNITVERLWRTLKQEAIYYYKPETAKELQQCLETFVQWYNHERLHQALNYKTPAAVYRKI